ncbi:MAG: F0F1 ATP synthase subunit B [Bacteroidales bacterium]|nr:F0F1 ATP synthase subunit B [Bacteroidales bacterium]
MGLELLTPDLGLLFWTMIIFLTLFFVLRKFAWDPILSVLKKREETIKEALDSVENARNEIQNLHNENEKLLHEARKERNEILQNAEQTSKKIIGEAKDVAQKEYDKFIEDARKTIEKEKKIVITELQNDLAKHAIDIAEKILREEMKNKKSYDRLIEKSIQEINLTEQ